MNGGFPSSLSLLIAISAAWVAGGPVAMAADPSDTASNPQLGAWGVDLTGMDRNVRPGDDFYSYVNGAWQARTEIPADKTQAGPAASLQDIALDQTRALLEEAAADTRAAKGSDRQKLGDWYASMLDEAKIESLGLAPLKPDFDRINAISDRTQLADLLAANNAGLGGTPIRISADFDRKHVNTMVLSIGVGGLSVGAREVYLEPAYEPIRKQLREHMARMFTLAGLDNGEARAGRVLGLEKRVAEVMWTATELRDRSRQFNPMPVTDGLDVVRGDALGNARRGAAFLKQRELSWLTTLPDRRIFLQPVYVVNAYAMAPWNEIAFLAAIVRPPFFDPKADKAVNYGALGAVIGHEISHLFDDQGRQTDADGLLRDWWTKADAERFVAATDKLAVQVSTYEPLPGKHVNGKLTLGESIADVAGLTVAYDAYRRSLGGKEPPVIDGFTAGQRFFLSYAQMWRWKPRDAYLDQLLKTDVHPPTHVRPYTVRNIDAWYTAFDVKPGAKLYLAPEARINPW